jgi:hypothetical protein
LIAMNADTIVDDPPSDALPPPRGRGRAFLDAVSALGTAAQAAVPGLYAWGVTVLPVAMSHGPPDEHARRVFARIAAVIGVASLAAAVATERLWSARARYVGVWGLALTSALVWVLLPKALSPIHLDAPRGIAGMAGWFLFAFASAAPALKRDPSAAERVVEDAPMRPRSMLRRGDAVYLAGGVALALALQLTGWGVHVEERAVLARLVTLTAGIAVIGAATTIALARHERAPRPPGRVRLRRASPAIVALVLLGLAGLLAWLRA